jgi:hypothetical protein
LKILKGSKRHNYVAEGACLRGTGITPHVAFVLDILQHEQTEISNCWFVFETLFLENSCNLIS